MSGLVAVLGSVTPPGRLHRALSESLARVDPDGVLVDLGERRIAFADGRQPADYADDTAATVGAIVEADAVVLATPVYRGTLTGALKNLLDHVPVEGLEGKTVGLVAMGATPHHYLGADRHLRDVLAWFGAVVVPTSVYLTSADFEGGAVRPAAAAGLDGLLASTLLLASVVAPVAFRLAPRPLASRRT